MTSSPVSMHLTKVSSLHHCDAPLACPWIQKYHDSTKFVMLRTSTQPAHWALRETPAQIPTRAPILLHSFLKYSYYRSLSSVYTVTRTTLFNGAVIDDVNSYTNISLYSAPFSLPSGFWFQEETKYFTSIPPFSINHCLSLPNTFERMECTGYAPKAIILNVAADLF